MEKCIVHFLPAMAGDCILIELEHPDCILIDCGYKTTYNTELRPLLLRLSAEGYRISLMIISHIDRDHIEGAVHFLRENGDAEIPAIIPVDEIWINGFFNTLFPRLEFKHREIDELSLEERKMLSDKLKSLKMSFPDEGYISATQCKALERLCVQNGYRVNCSCPDRIVKRSAMRYSEVATNRISIAGCQIAILNPGEPQLEALSRELDREMIRWFGRDYKIQQSDEFTQLFELLMELYPAVAGGADNLRYIQVHATTEGGTNITGITTLDERASAPSSLTLKDGYLNESTVVFEFRGGTSAAAYADVAYDAK